MGIVEDMILAERNSNEGELERQLNNVMDRSLETYIKFIAAKGLAGKFLGLDVDGSSIAPARSSDESALESILVAAPRTVLDLALRGRLPL